MMHGLIFFWLNVCLFVTASVIARRLTGQHSDNLLHVVSTGVVACSAIVLSIMALGIPGRLTTTNLTILWTIIALLAWCWNRLHSDRFKKNECHSTTPPVVWTPTMIFSGVIVFSVGVLYLHSFFRQLLIPPCNWDDLTYHFYFPASWIQSGTLNNPITALGDLAPTYSPMNTEMLNFWVMHAFRSDLIARVLQHLFLAVCAVLIAGIAKKLDVPNPSAVVSGAVFTAIPYFLTQGYRIPIEQTISNDITSLAFYLAAIYFGLHLATKHTLSMSILSGLACGLFLGSKYIAVVFAVPLCIWLVMQAGSLRQDRFRRLGAMSFAILMTGSFSYIRNWIVTGNPLYPSDISIGSIHLFSGIYQTETLRQSVYYSQFTWTRCLLHYPGYPLVLTLGLTIASLCAVFLMIWSMRRGFWRQDTCFLTILPWVNVALFYYLVPFRNERFLMFSIAPALVALGLAGRQAPLLSWTLLGSMSLGLIWVDIDSINSLKEFWLPTGIAVMSLLIGLIVLYLMHKKVREFRRQSVVFSYQTMGFLLLAVVCIWFIPYGIQWDHSIPPDQYFTKTRFKDQYPAWVNIMNTSEKISEPLRIAYAGLNCGYVYMGRDLRNRVFYIPVNDDGEFPHEFTSGLYRNHGDSNIWIDNLTEQRIDYLVCLSIQAPGMEDRWARQRHDYFSLEFEDTNSRIYRFHDPYPALHPSDSIPSFASLASFMAITPVVCPGGELLATSIWNVDSSERLKLEFTIGGRALGEFRYPSPSASPRAIYRIRGTVDHDMPIGLHPLDVTIRSVRSGETRNVHLGQIDVRDAASIPRPAATQIESPTDGELLTARSRFSWKPTSGTIKYKVSVIMPSGQTADHYVDDPNLDLFWDPESIKDLPAGTYRWHVTAIGASGTPSDPSEPRSFIVDHF